MFTICRISTWPAIWEVKGTDWPTGVCKALVAATTNPNFIVDLAI